MARRGRMCLVEGCERRAQLSQMVCKDHEGTAVGLEAAREVVKLEREMRALVKAEDGEARRGAAARFRKRIERGDFAAIFSGQFHDMLRVKGEETGLTNEIGALRLAVLRLMLEEDDPTKMATALSKVTNATVRALNAQKELNPPVDPVSAAIDLAWEEFEAEKAAEAASAAAQKSNAQVTKEWREAQRAAHVEPGLQETETASNENEPKPERKVYGNELERLFWEEDNPHAYHEHLARAAEAEGIGGGGR